LWPALDVAGGLSGVAPSPPPHLFPQALFLNWDGKITFSIKYPSNQIKVGDIGSFFASVAV
jgi:hypothetical protein